MERQVPGKIHKFYSTWRNKHGEWIIGGSTLLALMGGGVATLAEGPMGGLRFAVGLYAFSVGSYASATFVWEASKMTFISTRETMREKTNSQVSFPN